MTKIIINGLRSKYEFILTGVNMLIKHLITISLILSTAVFSDEIKTQPEIGIDDTFLGQKVDLELSFFDETGQFVVVSKPICANPIRVSLSITDMCRTHLFRAVVVNLNSPSGLKARMITFYSTNWN